RQKQRFRIVPRRARGFLDLGAGSAGFKRLSAAFWIMQIYVIEKLCGTIMEEVINLSRSLGADSRNLGEVGRRGALDRLERSKMLQQCALAGRANAGDFLQAGLADVLLAARAV